MPKNSCFFLLLCLWGFSHLNAQEALSLDTQVHGEALGSTLAQARPNPLPPNVLPPSRGILSRPPSSRVPVITPITPVGSSGSPSTLAETLAQATKDLRSPTENLRLSAAKLLGKYRVSQAGNLLLTVLGDSSVKVRRAAVHSLIESMSLYGPANEKILGMLGDEDAEIRREISNAIPQIRLRLFQSNTITRVVNGRVVTNSTPYRLPPALQRTVTLALDDPDSIVRQNILKYFTYLNMPFTAAMLEKRLVDPDRGVINVALDRIRIVPRTPEILTSLKAIGESEDLGLRRKLIASMRGMREPEIQDIQRSLQKDADPYVRVMAAVSLVGAGEQASPEIIQGVKDFLLQVDSTNSQVMTLFYCISDFGEAVARDIYTEMTGHKNSSLRRSAWLRVLNYDNGWNNPSRWTPVLKDVDKRVRQSVIGTVQGNLNPVPIKYIEEMIDSDFPDVRSLAGYLLARHPPAVVSEWMFDLLIDEEAQVRRAILQSVSNVRVKGWQDLLRKSLGDEDASIQRTAAYGLLADFRNSEPVLRSFIAKNRGKPIAIEISNELVRRTGVRTPAKGPF